MLLQVRVAAALSHKFADILLRPMASASTSLAKSEENYEMIDKGAYAIFFVEKNQQYFLGNILVLRKDHKPLDAIFGEHRGIPVMVARFNYYIQYINGINNQPMIFCLGLHYRQLGVLFPLT